MFTFLAFFSIGFSATLWAINAEIFPVHMIGTAFSLATAIFWLCNFLKSANFLTGMRHDPGKQNTFIMLALFSAMSYTFVYFFVPETGGKEIEENIIEILRKETNSDQNITNQDDEATKRL